MGFLGDIFGGGDSDYEAIQIPDFEEDKYFGQTQDILFPFGQNLLSGNIPEYYSPIGEIGGDIFENMLHSVETDVLTGANESLARMGVRGPRGADIAAKTLSSIIPKLRYEDLVRGLEGRQFLLGAGSDILSGVRSGSLDIMGMKNQYALQKAGLDIKQSLGQAELENSGGDLLSSLISTGANIYKTNKIGDILRGSAEGSSGGSSGGGDTASDVASMASTVASVMSLASMFSDICLKENITKIGKIKDLNIYRWNWKKGFEKMIGKTPNIGFIAQEVQKIYPSMVIKNEKGYLMIKYKELFEKEFN